MRGVEAERLERGGNPDSVASSSRSSRGSGLELALWESQICQELHLEETRVLVEEALHSLGGMRDDQSENLWMILADDVDRFETKDWIDEHKVFWSLQRALKLLPRPLDGAGMVPHAGHLNTLSTNRNAGELTLTSTAAPQQASTTHPIRKEVKFTKAQKDAARDLARLRSITDKLTVPSSLGQTEVVVGHFFKGRTPLPHADICYDGDTLFYNYIDVPFVGWRQEVYVAARHVDISTVNVAYIPPSSSAKIWTKSDLAIFFEQHSLDPSLMSHFKDFGRVGCVCHRAIESSSIPNQTVQCFYGLAGCGGFVHASCVGVQRIKQAPTVCPLCTAYIRASGDQKQLMDKRLDKNAARLISYIALEF